MAMLSEPSAWVAKQGAHLPDQNSPTDSGSRERVRNEYLGTGRLAYGLPHATGQQVGDDG